jgi:hypothetical protein
MGDGVMVHGGWIMEGGSWRMDHGGWIMEGGSWRVDHGGWIMEDGSWRMEEQGWLMERDCPKSGAKFHFAATCRDKRKR